jgi:hypothetical protein
MKYTSAELSIDRSVVRLTFDTVPQRAPNSSMP